MPEAGNAKYGLATYGIDEYGYFEVGTITPDIDAYYGIGGFGRSAYGLAEAAGFSDPRNCLFSIEARGKLNSPNPNFGGIYQTQPTSKGRITRKLKFYVPTNPQTELQQANRSKFADAVLAWQNLTSQQKLSYNERASGKPLSGYNLFLKEYLLSH